MQISRRSVLIAGAVLVTAPVVGCSAETPDKTPLRAPEEPPIAPQAVAMTIHRDPGCPCCDEWAEIARQAGYVVSIADDPDIQARKLQLGVPRDLWSCHTTEVGGYVLEGHVPMESLARLLESHDRAITGLAVAGMPLGSPGMEAGGIAEAYQVIAFAGSGARRVFAEYPASGAS